MATRSMTTRLCVIASACLRATGRAVCLAFARAMQRYGSAEEVLTCAQKPRARTGPLTSTLLPTALTAAGDLPS